MTLMSAAQLAERLGGVANGTTLRRWAQEGRVQNAYRLPNGRIVFTEDAIAEILQPTSCIEGEIEGVGKYAPETGDLP